MLEERIRWVQEGKALVKFLGISTDEIPGYTTNHVEKERKDKFKRVESEKRSQIDGKRLQIENEESEKRSQADDKRLQIEREESGKRLKIETVLNSFA